MSTTPGELYILMILIGSVVSMTGFKYLLSKETDKGYFGFMCFSISMIIWGTLVYVSSGNITFNNESIILNESIKYAFYVLFMAALTFSLLSFLMATINLIIELNDNKLEMLIAFSIYIFSLVMLFYFTPCLFDTCKSIYIDYGIIEINTNILNMWNSYADILVYLVVGELVGIGVLALLELWLDEEKEEIKKKLQNKCNEKYKTIKSKYIKKKEVEIKEEIQPKPVIKKRIVKKKIVKKPIKKE